MKCFRNILVGVDLSDADHLIASEPAPPTREAIEQALWLARGNAAQLTFLAAVKLVPRLQFLIRRQVGPALNAVRESASGKLDRWTDEAGRQAICGRSRLCFGPSWLELVRQVVAEHHDLVVVGSRNLSGLKRLFLGSTGLKLLRTCPCPVWIAKPASQIPLERILVVADFTPETRFVTTTAALLARVCRAQLHVLPVSTSRRSGAAKSDTAGRRIEEELARPEFAQLPEAPRLHVETGPLSRAVLKLVEREQIDLLVIETKNCSGIRSLVVSNPIEHILPRVPCSVLAVKPYGSICPVPLQSPAVQSVPVARVVTRPAALG